jgi:hypothetical protein
MFSHTSGSRPLCQNIVRIHLVQDRVSSACCLHQLAPPLSLHSEFLCPETQHMQTSDVTPCSLLKVYRDFGGKHSLHRRDEEYEWTNHVAKVTATIWQYVFRNINNHRPEYTGSYSKRWHSSLASSWKPHISHKGPVWGSGYMHPWNNKCISQHHYMCYSLVHFWSMLRGLYWSTCSEHQIVFKHQCQYDIICRN